VALAKQSPPTLKWKKKEWSSHLDSFAAHIHTYINTHTHHKHIHTYSPLSSPSYRLSPPHPIPYLPSCFHCPPQDDQFNNNLTRWIIHANEYFWVDHL
jgi:hypothetical protein